MAHRRDRKEQLRQERERREAEARAAQQRKRMVGIGAAALLAVAAIAVIVLVAAGGDDGGGSGVQSSGDNFPTGGSIPEQAEFDLQAAARAAGCELESERARSRDHINDVNAQVDYSSNPPTSGRHFNPPAEDGLYNGAPPTDVQLVHNLEHGRVIVWAKPSLPRAARQQLRALFDEDTYQMVFVRRRDMPFAVAATAWNADPTPLGTGRLMGCARWSDDVIDALRAFRDEHRSNGPEAIP